MSAVRQELFEVQLGRDFYYVIAASIGKAAESVKKIIGPEYEKSPRVENVKRLGARHASSPRIFC